MMEWRNFGDVSIDHGQTWIGSGGDDYAACVTVNSGSDIQLCNGLIHNALWQGDKATRAWRIFNYLTYDRASRAVKTMAQWRVAFAKPWETTPMGQL